jgi:DNA-binding transcriptional LysR family regulator
VVSLALALRDGIPLEPFVPHLLALAKAFKEFDFRIKRGLPAELENDLKEGQIEILLGPKPEVAWDRLEHWPLFHCDYSLVFRADHPLSRKEHIGVEDLNHVSLLHRPDCGVSTNLLSHLEKAGIVLQPALQFAREDDLITYLASSSSVAYLPNFSILRGPLVRRDLQGPDCSFDMYATTVAGRQRGPALNLFLTQLRAADWKSEVV